MVKHHYIKFIALFALNFFYFSITRPINAQAVQAEAPNQVTQAAVSSEKVDVEAAKKMVIDGIGAFPKRIIVLSEMEEEELPILAEISGSPADFAFFEVVNSKQLTWDLKINYRSIKKQSGVQLAQRLSGTDMMVHAPKSGSWVLYRFGKNGDPEKIGEKPGVALNYRALAAWIFSVLGWDGVVLGKKGEGLVVGASAEILGKEGLQALSVNHSHSKWSLQESERKGSGILSLTHREGPFAHFEVVFIGSGVQTIPVGTKLIIEKKK